MQTQSTGIIQKNGAAKDAKWYHQFKAIGSFQERTFLNGDKALRLAQKQLFISDKIQNPELDYPRLDYQLFQELKKALLALQKDISAEETNEIIKQAYIWKLEEKLAEIELLLAAIQKDMESFLKYSEFIYGTPSKELFNGIIMHIKKRAKKHTDSKSDDIKKSAKELLDSLADIPEAQDTADLFHTDDQILAGLQINLLNDLGMLIGGFEEKKEYVGPQIRDVFEIVLKNSNISGWNVVIDPSSSSAISVNHERKELMVPATRRVNHTQLKGLIIHEIGTHILRRINGEKSPLMLLGLGLARYERGDEGVATIREQIVKGKIDKFNRVSRYLAICLALGIDGRPRDFRDVYEIVKKYMTFKSALKGQEYGQAVDKAKMNAWTVCIRAFRGTDCVTRGACFTKDIIYFEGNAKIWSLLSKDPNVSAKFNVGKYDPLNPRHLWLLEKLNIS